MTVESSISFVQIFETRRDSCRSLLELSRRQTAMIADDDYAGLLDILQQKQKLLARFHEHGQNRPEFWKHWQATRNLLPHPERQECEQNLAETELILAELLDHEHFSETSLVERRNATQKQLHGMTVGAQVHDAYRDSLAPATNRHLDIGQ